MEGTLKDRGIAQSGSALALGDCDSGCRGFEQDVGSSNLSTPTNF